MNNLEYQLSKKGRCFHWINWKSFIDKDKSVFNEKNSDVCILFVCCNSFNLFKKCNEYLQKESNQNFDILVVDNSTNEENIELFHEVGIEDQRISILKPIDNIGGSGGFSIGMEYIISKDYKTLIIFEDDIIPVDDNIITEMISISDDSHIIKNSYVNIPECECWVFHLVLYPMNIIKKIGVSDPRYFLKCDDTDFDIRLKKNNIQSKFTGKRLFHPNLKCDGWKNWILAFSIRNGLVLLQNQFSISFMLKTIVDQLLFIWYGISKIFIEKSLGVLHIYFCGFWDFLVGHIGYRYNLKLLNKYKGIDIPKLNLSTEEANIQKFSDFSNDKYYLYLKFVYYDGILGNIPFSNKFFNSKHGIIAGGLLCPLYPIFMLFKHVIFLEEYMYENETVKYEYYNNDKYLFTIIKLCLSFLLSIVIWIPIIIIIFIKFIIDVINKNGKYSNLV